MFGIRNLYKLIMGNASQPTMGVVPHANPPNSIISNNPSQLSHHHDDESPMAKALIAVFGMDKDGRIAKEKACNVVKQLGLVVKEDESRFEDMMILEEDDDELLGVEEVLKDLEENNKDKEELVRQAFMVFDEDNDGYIDAKEIKRIFACLGLDNGWDVLHIQKMIQAVDLNLDGKVDFHEFQLMMMMG